MNMNMNKKDGSPRKTPVRVSVDPAAAVPAQLLRLLAHANLSKSQKLNALAFVLGTVQAEA